MKIVLDDSVCEAHGMCEAMAHEYFELEDDKEVVTILDEHPPESERVDVQAAVNACPVSALTLDG